MYEGGVCMRVACVGGWRVYEGGVCRGWCVCEGGMCRRVVCVGGWCVMGCYS